MAYLPNTDAQPGGPSSFYRQVGEHEFESTVATMSPWDPSLQHGGPPSALLARAIEQATTTPDLAVARFSVDFFGGVPQGRVTTSTQVVRPGRRIELVESTLEAAGRVVAVARAWRIKPSPDAVEAVVIAPRVALPGPQPYEPMRSTDSDWGYGQAIEWRFVDGAGELRSPAGPGPVWMRLRLPLVEGEQTTGLQRMLVVADSINGVSAVLDFRQWLVVPPGLTLHAHRVDAGEWLLLDATTVLDPNGVALAHGTIADERSRLGLVSQPLLVQRRP